jgi:hypothetical protein
MALGSTQLLTEMSTRNLPWGGGGVKDSWSVGLTTSPPSVIRLSRKMWELRRLTTLRASTACYRDSFIFITHSLPFLMQIKCSQSLLYPAALRSYLIWLWLIQGRSPPEESRKRYRPSHRTRSWSFAVYILSSVYCLLCLLFFCSFEGPAVLFVLNVLAEDCVSFWCREYKENIDDKSEESKGYITSAKKTKNKQTNKAQKV